MGSSHRQSDGASRDWLRCDDYGFRQEATSRRSGTAVLRKPRKSNSTVRSRVEFPAVLRAHHSGSRLGHAWALRKRRMPMPSSPLPPPLINPQRRSHQSGYSHSAVNACFPSRAACDRGSVRKQRHSAKMHMRRLPLRMLTEAVNRRLSAWSSTASIADPAPLIRD